MFNGKQSIGVHVLTLLLLLLSVLNSQAQTEVDEQLALQYFQNQEYNKAAELYQGIYQRKPSPYFYNYYLDCLLAMQDYKTAKSFVNQVAKKNPGQLKYQVEEAYVLQQSGNGEKAQKIYEKLAKNGGKSRAEALSLADAFMVRNQNQFALKTLQKAKKDFNDQPLNMELADLYFKMGDLEAMMAEYLDLADLSDSYLNQVQSRLQMIISDPSQESLSESLRAELIRRTQKYPNKTLYSEFLYWYSIQRKEYDLALIQAKALGRQFNDGGNRVYELANILMSNEQYALAVDAYQVILDMGNKSNFYNAADINILQAKFMKITAQKNFQTNELVVLESEYLKKIDLYGRNSTTVLMMINLSYLQAFYLDKIELAKQNLIPIESMPNVQAESKAQAKLMLADMMLFSGEKWGASLLYKQVEKAFKNEPVGFEAKYKVAKFFYFVGEMEWAKVQLKVLSGATSKLIANDALDLYLRITENISPDSSYDALSIYARAELLTYQKQYKRAIQTMDTLISLFPNDPIIDDAYFQKAMIAKDLKEYSKADSLLAQTFEYNRFGSLADNALIERARLFDYVFEEKQRAQTLYQQIILEYQGSLFTVEARMRYRALQNKPEQ